MEEPEAAEKQEILKRKVEKKPDRLDEYVKYDIDCVTRRTNELLEKYPDHETEILSALDVSDKLSRKLSAEEK